MNIHTKKNNLQPTDEQHTTPLWVSIKKTYIKNTNFRNDSLLPSRDDFCIYISIL